MYIQNRISSSRHLLIWHLLEICNVKGYKVKVDDLSFFVSMMTLIGVIIKKNQEYVLTEYILCEELNKKFIDYLIVKNIKLYEYKRILKIKKLKNKIKWQE